MTYVKQEHPSAMATSRRTVDAPKFPKACTAAVKTEPGATVAPKIPKASMAAVKTETIAAIAAVSHGCMTDPVAPKRGSGVKRELLALSADENGRRRRSLRKLA